jgi:hypothetical protein
MGRLWDSSSWATPDLSALRWSCSTWVGVRGGKAGGQLLSFSSECGRLATPSFGVGGLVSDLVVFQRAHGSLASVLLQGSPMSSGVVFHDMLKLRYSPG